VLPRVSQLRTSPPCRGGLRRCHVSHGPGPHLLAKLSSGAVTRYSALDLASLPRWAQTLPRGLGPHLLAELSSDAATCSSTPDLASLSRWSPALSHVHGSGLCLSERRALTLSHVPQLRTSPPCRDGLRRCHVALASPLREESSGAATYPTAPSGL
jgi:hypothetical protein